MVARVRLLALMAALPALAGCGGGGSDSMPKAHSSRPGAATVPGGADAASVRTIRNWVNAERGNRSARAASYFSLPAIVLNGNEPLLLRKRADAVLWNASLPCGAILVRAVDVRGWTIVRFRLTNRQGGNCDSPGNTASTAFALRRGKIAMWIRIRDDVAPARAAPPRPPDRAFMRSGRVPGQPAPGPDPRGELSPSV